MKSVEQILIECVELCDRLHIPYAVMGGLAVRVHGIPRPTYDVDLTIAANSKLLESLFEEAEQAGYTVPETYKSGWMDRVADMPIVKLRTWLDDGKGIDVDLFVAESDFQKSLLARRMQCEMEHRQLSVISPEDLILLKLLANRPRDLGDIQDVLFMQGQLDETYLRKWAAAIGITARLEACLDQRI